MKKHKYSFGFLDPKSGEFYGHSIIVYEITPEPKPNMEDKILFLKSRRNGHNK